MRSMVRTSSSRGCTSGRGCFMTRSSPGVSCLLSPSPWMGEGLVFSLPLDGGGSCLLPPPRWGRVLSSPSPSLGEGLVFSLPLVGGGSCLLPPPRWGRVGVGVRKDSKIPPTLTLPHQEGGDRLFP